MNKRNILLSGTVIASMLASQCVFAEDIKVTPSKNSLVLNDNGVVENVEAVPAYMYRDNNYFMLRDIGKITGYKIDWDNDTKKVLITKDDTAKDLKSLGQVEQGKDIVASKQTIKAGETEYNDINCLNIDGYNYFKLRDMEEIMDFKCDWDGEANSIIITTGTNENAEIADSIPVEMFLQKDLKQQVIEEDVAYMAGSKDYSGLEKYMQNNVDEKFNADDYIISEINDKIPSVVNLMVNLNVNGVPSKNFGYKVTVINSMAKVVTFVGEMNPEFDIENIEKPQFDDEKAKQMAVEADGTEYKIESQNVTNYFDMNELSYKTEVETEYLCEDGTYTTTSHIF